MNVTCEADTNQASLVSFFIFILLIDAKLLGFNLEKRKSKSVEAPSRKAFSSKQTICKTKMIFFFFFDYVNGCC